MNELERRRRELHNLCAKVEIATRIREGIKIIQKRR